MKSMRLRFIQMLPAMAMVSLSVIYAKENAATLKLDVAYKVTAQGPLKLDLHYPAAPKAGDKFPLILFTHGGGWSAGSKTIRPDSPPRLMMQGDKDPTIPVHHARYMKQRADVVKAPVEILIVQNSGHNWREVDGTLRPLLDEIIAKTSAFMKQHLDQSTKH